MDGSLESLPSAARPAVTALLSELHEEPVHSLTVYGPAARADYDPERHELDILLELEDASPAALRVLAPATRRGFRVHRVTPFVVATGELARVADVFPLRVREILRAHQTVRGPDPTAGVSVSRPHLRLRVEQELRNMLSRLRREELIGPAARTGAGPALANVSRRLRRCADALLELAGAPAAADLAGGLSRLSGADGELLAALLEERPLSPELDAPRLAAEAITALAVLVNFADGLDVSPP